MHSHPTQDTADFLQHAARTLMFARRFGKMRRRDVATETRRIAEMLGPEFAIPACSLADIERGRVIPTFCRLASLCAVYRLEMRQMLDWYGIQPRAQLIGSQAAA